jgi:hypothetical protein
MTYLEGQDFLSVNDNYSSKQSESKMFKYVFFPILYSQAFIHINKFREVCVNFLNMKYIFSTSHANDENKSLHVYIITIGKLEKNIKTVLGIKLR